jgi:hypothetical protein
VQLTGNDIDSILTSPENDYWKVRHKDFKDCNANFDMAVTQGV